MADDPKSGAEPSVRELVSGIAQDAQNLLGQQLALLRREIHGEVRRAIRAAISLGVGGAVTVLGGMLLVLTLIHLLNAVTSIPLWGCYGLVGGSLLGIGGVLLFFGGRGVSEVQLIKPPQTTEALKENLEWLKKQTTSNPT